MGRGFPGGPPIEAPNNLERMPAPPTGQPGLTVRDQIKTRQQEKRRRQKGDVPKKPGAGVETQRPTTRTPMRGEDAPVAGQRRNFRRIGRGGGSAAGPSPVDRSNLTPEQRLERRGRRFDRFTERGVDFFNRAQLASDRADRIERNMEAGKGRFGPSGQYGSVGPLLGAGQIDLQRERADRLKQKAENMRSKADNIRSRINFDVPGVVENVANAAPKPTRGQNTDMQARGPHNAERARMLEERRIQAGGYTRQVPKRRGRRIR